MMRRLARIGVPPLLTLALLLAACAGTEVPPTTTARRPAVDITRVSYAAADALAAQIRPQLAPEAPLVVATLVNLNRLDESSPLGRLITEQVAGRFVQGGYRVVEVKLRSQLYMKRNEGELILTREVRDIARQHNARAIVAGTYAESADRVFVNMKVIELDGNVVLGAVDYQLDRDALVRSLLPARQ
ncbi:MAG: hypothetical protein IPP18_01290 [Rhodocyclaceae bacterium]|nr:hypothetical protein [Rhodocyclaceae bacterium]